MRAWPGAALSLGALLGACGARELPPLPEALVIVETDLPIPRGAARLRIDLYGEEGRWFDTRDVALPSPSDWPASFGIYSDDESRSRTVFVRLRAYPEGAVRDYRGERFVDWGSTLTPPPSARAPRLVADGSELTPAFEPEPLVTIDRMVSVRLDPSRRGAVRTLLAGACVGTMAELGPAPSSEEAIDVNGLASCIATEKVREPVVPVTVEDDRSIAATRPPTWGDEEPCQTADTAEATSTRDARVCVPSGVVLLGNRSLLVTPYIASVPERTFRLSRFWVDAHEVSVARFRNALARGFAPTRMPAALEAPLGTSATDTCSWSAKPMGREELPVTCIPWPTARAYCKFQGGDLPTEAQWEYLATTAGRRFETMYPWGDDEPDCDRAVYERLPGNYDECTAVGTGPQPVSSLVNDLNPLGIMGLAGNVSEWVRDRFVEYSSPCWSSAAITDPVCDGPGGPRILRGGSWVSPRLFARGAMRQGHQDFATLSFEGVRCAYTTR